MRVKRLSSCLASLALLLLCAVSSQAQMSESLETAESERVAQDEFFVASDALQPKLQVAILIDTSLSMKGLVDQARFQIWNVVAELAKAKRQGQLAKLEIAVYDYGNIWNPEQDGFVSQVIGFTSDMDKVSRALFSLRIDQGRCGQEYCGTAIARSVADLQWDFDESVYRSIVIAGNEPFNQGEIKFGQSLPLLRQQNVAVNSIYCLDPDYDESLVGLELWRLASELTGGRFAQINHNHELPDIMTPYDAELRRLNRLMNETFLWYGEGWQHAKENQHQQDANAKELSDHAFAARMSAKIGHLYHHIEHDLVDAYQHQQLRMDELDEDFMPESLQDLAMDEQLSAIQEMAEKREGIRRQMAETLAERNLLLTRQMQESLGDEEPATQMWGDALIESIRRQAMERGFEF